MIGVSHTMRVGKMSRFRAVLVRLFDETARVGLGFGRRDAAAQHAGELGDPIAGLERSCPGDRSSAFPPLLDGEMVIGISGNLRQMGDAEELAVGGERFQSACHGIGHAAAEITAV